MLVLAQGLPPPRNPDCPLSLALNEPYPILLLLFLLISQALVSCKLHASPEPASSRLRTCPQRLCWFSCGTVSLPLLAIAYKVLPNGSWHHGAPDVERHGLCSKVAVRHSGLEAGGSEEVCVWSLTKQCIIT